MALSNSYFTVPVEVDAAVQNGNMSLQAVEEAFDLAASLEAFLIEVAIDRGDVVSFKIRARAEWIDAAEALALASVPVGGLIVGSRKIPEGLNILNLSNIAFTGSLVAGQEIEVYASEGDAFTAQATSDIARAGILDSTGYTDDAAPSERDYLNREMFAHQTHTVVRFINKSATPFKMTTANTLTLTYDDGITTVVAGPSLPVVPLGHADANDRVYLAVGTASLPQVAEMWLDSSGNAYNARPAGAGADYGRSVLAAGAPLPTVGQTVFDDEYAAYPADYPGKTQASIDLSAATKTVVACEAGGKAMSFQYTGATLKNVYDSGGALQATVATQTIQSDADFAVGTAENEYMCVALSAKAAKATGCANVPDSGVPTQEMSLATFAG